MPHCVLLQTIAFYRQQTQRKIMLKRLITIVVAAVITAPLFASTFKETYDEAVKQDKARKYTEAAQGFAKALEQAQNPKEKFNALYGQAESLRKARKFDDAAAVFKQAAAVEGASGSDKSRAQRRAGQTYLWSGDKNYDKALTEYEAVLVIEKAHPHNTSGALLEMADIYYRQKKYDLSDETLNKLLSQDKAHPHHVSRAYIVKGNNLRAQKKYDEAVESYQKAVTSPKAHAHHISEGHRMAGNVPVSYTHLTLPTILLVQISVVAVSLKKKKQNQSIKFNRNIIQITQKKYQIQYIY
eukprot:TRINITY_DN17036_c0_g2_i3.p1 TRINITY_DN17036_c0_g2~~TRINITY_DN17036_c0_g2_i3.p1  ORF type:complete len:298 (-),score=54.05 TRINITY_DN17036_c0_g2_i3:12-905(-)